MFLDVLEEENEEDVFRRYTSNNNNVNRKRYSSIDSTASSLDALWDTHHRRLSEAGLSRHSDSSAVLTEDTDSFIIGQRVWVSGSKPGHIAFIGETQFAPGEWAGIALDEPIGKNDGSVGGTRYFQCEPKKGVFSRLTRLTRVPLEREGMGSGETYATTPSPVGNGYRRSPISPTGSTKGLFKTPMSVGGSTASLMSSASHVIDYRIGDRVIIKSGQGSKVGTVRFMGTAEFAPGEWVGVELDDPRGKNDGAVNGVRYFECQPNYGLFAPVSKVSKSPSKVKPGSCQVHTGGPGLPPSGIKRAGSKESMSNMSMTSAASSVRRVRLGVTSLTPKKTTITTSSTPMPTRTALQDVLKEKQQHIEHLLKERDMERAEITRAASLADEAEQKLTTLRQEYDKYRAECENKLKEHLGLLNKLKEDRNELVSQLDEEKRKNEDLQFRIEESSITKEDIELSNENHIAKIKELEEQLSKERDKVDNLETEAYKLFEAEENLIKSKEETELLRKQIQEARNREHTLEGASATTTSLIASLEKETDQYKIDLDEKNETISVLRQEVNQLTMQMKKQLEESTTMKTDLEALCSIKEKELSNLKEELSETNNLVKEKIDAVTKITSEKLGSEATLEKEVDRLKMDLSAKISDLEISSDSLKAKELEMENMRKEYDSLNEQLKKIDIGRDELVKDLTAKIQEQDKTIEEITKTNNDLVEGTDVLKNELQKIKTDSESSRAEMENNFEKTLAERDIKLKEMSLEIQQKNEETLKNIDVLENFKMEFERKRLEFEETKTALEAAKKETDNIVLTKNTEISQISKVESQRHPHTNPSN
ncbi:hypothetical protein JTB14_034240 [Gonioctena quinquepunctata]|nr:hypothetical protein JTB14_034240 [Gonioctena quinquepunctata]